MILNNHMFNLYIRSLISHLRPCHRPVLQIERDKWHTCIVKQHCSPAYASAEESKIERCMQFKTNFVQLIWQWATYECVCYINMLHRGKPPLWVVVPPILRFSVCVYSMWRHRTHCRSGTVEATLPPQYSVGWQRGPISPADSSLIPISVSDRAV